MNFDNIPFQLETSRLLLVPTSMKNFENRARIASDIENTKIMMFLPKPKEETFDYIKICETQWGSENQTLFEFDILLKEENNKFIGGISFELLFENPEIVKIFGKNCADMGWILDKNFWNKGFASESAKCVLEFTKSLGVKKMIAQCDAENIGSWRVMEKIGMKRICDNGKRFNKSEPNIEKTEYTYAIYF
ncbi:MAG: GNAT family N-acetyltransferase [Spirochaetaceae bacterium]|nr:GNAT family N-acetyltransferase [Spirochaetaceae bacterium]